MGINSQLLRAKIVERGKNNGKLATEMGVNPGTISNVITGKTVPSFPVVEGISIILKLKPEEFYEIFLPDLLARLV